jgi:hypothetical protein
VCRQKTLGVTHSSYSRRDVFCNEFFTGAFDRLLGEALPREVARRSGPSAALGGDALSSSVLCLEARERFCDQIGSDAPSFQVVADQEITGAAPSKEIRAPPGQPAVVDRPGAHEPLDGLLPHGHGHVPPRQPLLELSLRQIAVRDRPCGSLQRLVLTEPARQPASPLPVELDAHVQTGREHNFGGQGPPRLALELDLDSSARPRAQGANSWRRPSP